MISYFLLFLCLSYTLRGATFSIMYMFLLAGKNIPGVEYLQGELLFVKQIFSDY